FGNVVQVSAQVQVTKGSTHHYSVAPIQDGAIYNYHWLVTPGGTSSDLSAKDSSSNILWDGATGEYTISVYPTKPGSACAGNVQTLVVEVSDMHIAWSEAGTAECSRTRHQSGDFNITANYTGILGVWSFEYTIDGGAEQTVNVTNGNYAIISIDGFTHTSGSNPEIHTIRISSVTSRDNCTVNYTGTETDAAARLYTVVVDPPPNIYLGADTMLCEHNELILSTGVINGTYLWSNGENSPTIIAHERDGQIWVRVTDSKGCIGTDTIQILDCINQLNLIIPNAFTPNGDGYNDYFQITGFENYPNISVRIYNTFGSQVFQSDHGYAQPWDGTQNGKKLPVNAYYYVIDPGNGSKAIVGSITLIR
ncbi:MAG: gliding motility-associated C-terminal domain-containing protein, partial [Bacteroidales bacterium]|nr:gliding motility-associated C-terminal domain-containing protein [Bacteroidales bacterium]